MHLFLIYRSKDLNEYFDFLYFPRLNQLLSQTSAYSDFLIKKVPEKLRKQLEADKTSASFEVQKAAEEKKKLELVFFFHLYCCTSNIPSYYVCGGGKEGGWEGW